MHVHTEYRIIMNIIFIDILEKQTVYSKKKINILHLKLNVLEAFQIKKLKKAPNYLF